MGGASVSHLQGATGEVTDVAVESRRRASVGPAELSAVAALLDGDLQGAHALQVHTHTQVRNTLKTRLGADRT